MLVAQQCINLGMSKGIAADHFLATAGITPKQLADLNGWLPLSVIERLLNFLMQQLGDPLMGLRAAPHINLAALGVLGFVVQTSSTLQNLIETTIRFEPLLGDVSITRLHHEPGAALWRLEHRITDPLAARLVTECVLGCWAGQLRLLIQHQPRPLLAVRFQHAPPKDRHLLREYEEFFHCPVHFNQAASELVLSPASLSLALTLANPDLHQTLEQHAVAVLSQRQSGISFIDQVKSILRAQLQQGTSPLREQVAELLGMSGRSLHRRLQEQDSNYREVLDDVRFDLARKALHGSARSIESVALQLGFQESQSFIRWFRQMAGTTPGEFRQQQDRPSP